MNKPEQPVEAAKTAHDIPASATEPADVASAKAQPKKKESWFEVAKTIVYALLIAGVIRSFLFQPFNIPSGSMEDTLLIGDYLFVSKWAYGYSRYSFPFAIFPFNGRFFSGTPARGDIVVFKYPVDNSTDYIKRLIGLPGDRIQMKEGVLYINEQPAPQTRIDDFVGMNPCPVGSDKVEGPIEGIVHVPRFIETLPNGVRHEILDCSSNGSLDTTQVFVVPEGHYFMMGDNRDNSADSRADVGYVPFENFVGRAEIIFFSTDGSARLWEVWRWPFGIRYGRIGQLTR